MKKLKKVIVIFLIIIFIFQVFAPICVFADDMTVEQGEDPDTGDDEESTSTTSGSSGSSSGGYVDVSFGDQALTWGAGLLYYPIQLLIGLVTEVLESIASAMAGKSNVTAEDVLFNKVPLIDTNFFDTGDAKDTFVSAVRQSVASWYYGIRTIAIVASLLVLIYIAIRMSIASTGDEKGKYKEMLKDWLMSFALVFVLHYIMMLVLYGNNEIVKVIYTSTQNVSTVIGDVQADKLEKYLQSLKDIRYTPNLSTPVATKFGANIVCLLLGGITIAFLIQYIKRFIVIAFLMIIAPLITITYAIDKVKDGKAQALNAWFKEFFWTVLIQPFHCLIYVVFVTTALSLVQDGKFATSILAIFCMGFILQAEDIVKKIFGIQADDVGKLSAATALVAGGMITTMRGAGKAAGNAAKKSTANQSAPKKAPATKDTNKNTGAALNTANNTNNSGNTNNAGATNDNSNGNTNASTVQTNTKNVKPEDLRDPNARLDMPKAEDAASSTPKAKAAMGKFMDALNNTTATKYAGRIIKGYAMAGLGVSGAALSLLTDKPNISGAVVGFGAGVGVANAGESLVKYAGNGLGNFLDNRRLKSRQSELDTAYDDYYNSNPSNSHAVIQEKAEELIHLDLSSVGDAITPVEKRFAETLQGLYDQYEKMGYEDPEKEVLTRVHLKDDQNN